MKKLLTTLSALVGLLVIVYGIFFVNIFVKEFALRKDLKELESCDYELMYHISGDSDFLDMDGFMEGNPQITAKWLGEYIQKMEQGGVISGEMCGDVVHANVYAEGESDASIECYLTDEKIFGVKKTMDYILGGVAEATKLPIDVLQMATPDGYISWEQIKTLLGVESVEGGNSVDLMAIRNTVIENIKWFFPGSPEDNHFEEQLGDVDMTYCSFKMNVEGIGVQKIYLGICNEDTENYLYIQVEDLSRKKGTNLEIMLHVTEADYSSIEVPETISDNIVDKLASVISLMNSLS